MGDLDLNSPNSQTGEKNSVSFLHATSVLNVERPKIISTDKGKWRVSGRDCQGANQTSSVNLATAVYAYNQNSCSKLCALQLFL